MGLVRDSGKPTKSLPLAWRPRTPFSNFSALLAQDAHRVKAKQNQSRRLVAPAMRDLSLVRFILLRLGLPIPRGVTLMSLDKLLTFEQSTIYYFGDWGSHSPATCEEED